MIPSSLGVARGYLLVTLAFTFYLHIQIATNAYTPQLRGTVHEVAQHDNDSNVYDAVIVGAGWAGLKAAKTFLDSGITNILVLEANSYVGGRSKSINFDGSINALSTESDNIPMEAGSEWLFTGTGMANYLSQNGFIKNAPLTDDRAYNGVYKGAMMYNQTLHSNGTITTQKLMNAHHFKDKVWGGYQPFKNKRINMPKDESWADTMEAYKKEAKLNKTEVQYLDLIGSVAKLEHTSDATKLSVRENSLMVGHIPSTKYLAIRGLGFGNIARQFAELFSDKIEINTTVHEIVYHGQDNASVKYVDVGKMMQVAAKTVLVTVSLGVLKAGNIKFTPSLPTYKQEVIDGMGFGLANKCAMYWNNAEDMVWPEEQFWFELISTKETKWNSFFNPSAYKDTQTLTAWIGGSDALEMEKLTDDEILDMVVKNLKSMFPSIKRPDKVMITRWSQDENTRGTYSYETVNRNWEEDTEKLRRNVGSLWFAGEATDDSMHETTIGAWDSGREAAQEMMKRL